MHVAVRQHCVGGRPSRLARRALLLLLDAWDGVARLAMPVHSDEAVVEDRLGAGYGSPGLFVLCVLNQRRLWVSAKHHLECE